mmetsp:Transcript_856/g.1658  ORF Transcript_856/g.1658 Transcript_856/m.1658 type:complete len:221 (+) Transcript_856:415-1077(+)
MVQDVLGEAQLGSADSHLHLLLVLLLTGLVCNNTRKSSQGKAEDGHPDQAIEADQDHIGISLANGLKSSGAQRCHGKIQALHKAPVAHHASHECTQSNPSQPCCPHKDQPLVRYYNVPGFAQQSSAFVVDLHDFLYGDIVIFEQIHLTVCSLKCLNCQQHPLSMGGCIEIRHDFLDLLVVLFHFVDEVGHKLWIFYEEIPHLEHGKTGITVGVTSMCESG